LFELTPDYQRLRMRAASARPTMLIDTATLFLIEVIVMIAVALLLIWAWLQNRSVTTLAWWSVALMLEAIGTGLVAFRGMIPDWLSIDMANASLIMACGLLWAGARSFNMRPVNLAFPIGAAIWMIACQFDGFYASLQLRATLFSILVTVYVVLTAWEFWRGTEPLASRPFIVACLVVHALGFLFYLPVVFFAPELQASTVLGGNWFIFVGFQGL